jgi:hypothetical protein
MSPEDKEYLRALYAGMAMMGLVMREGVIDNSGLEIDAWVMANRMMRELEPQEEGIVKARKKRV